MAKFSSSPGKVHFECLVHLLRYIRDKNNLGLEYYAKTEDTPLSELLIQYSIKSGNQVMVLQYSSWKYCPDTGIITGSYILFFQGGLISHFTHVPGPVAKCSAESECNT